MKPAFTLMLLAAVGACVCSCDRSEHATAPTTAAATVVQIPELDRFADSLVRLESDFEIGAADATIGGHVADAEVAKRSAASRTTSGAPQTAHRHLTTALDHYKQAYKNRTMLVGFREKAENPPPYADERVIQTRWDLVEKTQESINKHIASAKRETKKARGLMAAPQQ